MASGPLQGLKVIELAGLGPGPFCGMLLSDMGADVLRIDRPGSRAQSDPRIDIDGRGRRSIELDLKRPESIALCLELCEVADVIFEGYRPGVAERLGLGPETVLERNPRIVYGRMTGWGQQGSVRTARRPRPQLHRDLRSAGRDRHARQAGAAAQPSSATTAAERCSLPWACSPRC
jgi:alpha-methylacyl-CoA racemase